jgi:hypothetical protein
MYRLKKTVNLFFLLLLTSLAYCVNVNNNLTIKNTVKDIDGFPWENATVMPDKLDVYNAKKGAAINTTIACLQGLLAAKGSSEQIWMQTEHWPSDNYADKFWLEKLPVEKVEGNSAVDLLKKFSSDFNGWILCDKSSVDQINIASTIAGVKNWLPVLVDSNEALPVELFVIAEKEVMLDLRSDNYDYDRVITEFGDQLNKNIAIEIYPFDGWDTASLNGDLHFALRDYAVLTKSIVFHAGTSKEEFDSVKRGKIMDFLNPNSVIFGWGPVSGAVEKGYIEDTSKNNDFYIPADHQRNLSVLSEFFPDEINYTVSEKLPVVSNIKSGKHPICIVMSDGDNLQWIYNRADDKRWWGNDMRGILPIGWMMPPSAYYLTNPIWQYFNNTRSEVDGRYLDEFYVGVSGAGFFFPDYYSKTELANQLQMIDKFIGRTGVDVMSIYGMAGFDWQNAWYLDEYAKTENAKGAMYFDFGYWGTAVPGVKIINGKPFVGVTDYLMHYKRPTADVINDIKNRINKNIENPTEVDGYTLIYVEAWWNEWKGENENPFKPIKEVYDAFKDNPDVQFVTPGELMGLMRKSL